MTSTATVSIRVLGITQTTEPDRYNTDADEVLVVDDADGTATPGDDSDDGVAVNDMPNIPIVNVAFSPNHLDNQTTLPSGATLAFNSDGTFEYDPADGFVWLAEGDTAIDTFSYGRESARQPIHRYSFDGVGGDGAVLTDSIGGADGVLRVDDASSTLTGDGRLLLGGGSSEVAGYADLPNGLVSGLADATIEGWVTLDANLTWQRIFSFGSSEGDPPEITGPGDTNGGGTVAVDTFALTSDGNNPNVRHIEFLDSDTGTRTNRSSKIPAETPLGVEYHFAVTIDDDAGIGGMPLVSLYRNGLLVGNFTSNVRLADLNDVNNWLGRSQWMQDANLQGSYNEFRIWDIALPPAEVAGSFASGPDGTPSIQTNVEIELTGLNDPPQATDVTVELDEHATIGTVVATANSYASDIDTTDVLTYSFADGDDNSIFSIDPSNGEITVAHPIQLDFETSPTLSLTVEVMDDAHTPLLVTSTVTVLLQDIEELPIYLAQQNSELDANDVDGLATPDDPGDDGVLVGADATTVAEVQGEAGNVGTPTVLPSGATLTVRADGTFNYDPVGIFDSLRDGDVVFDTFSYGVDRADHVPIHRYSFDGTGSDGAILTDSIGGSDGVLREADDVSELSGGSLVLGGGDSTTAGYGDLPNRLVSGLTDATFEAWLTVTGVHNWMRIFDFGSSQPGDNPEIIGPGDTNEGGGAGEDYFFLTPVRGQNINQQRLTFRNIHPDAPGGGTAPNLNPEQAFDPNLVTELEREYHWVVTVDDDGGSDGLSLVSLYRDGIFVGSYQPNIRLADINDVNNWLGRSNFTNDGNLQGSFNEFRIWDKALTANEVATSFASGPDQLPRQYRNVSIAVLGENDEPFGTQLRLSISQATPNGTVLTEGLQYADDIDSGDAITNYEFLAGNESGAFTIDSATGTIRVADNSQLNFAETPQIFLSIGFTDSAIEPLSGSATIIVDVTESNELEITQLTPSNHQIGGFDSTADLVVEFDRDIAFGSGFVTLRHVCTNEAIERFDVEAGVPALTIDGNQLIINPTNSLPDNRQFFVEIDSTALAASAPSNAMFAGIGRNEWNFGTGLEDVYLNEILFNPDDGDTGREYVELRGCVSPSTYVVVIQGDDGEQGLVSHYFDLGAMPISGREFTLLLQGSQDYANLVVDAAVNVATSDGWESSWASGAGNFSNGSLSFLLIRTESTPVIGEDVDPENNGTLSGVAKQWQIFDSIGVLDGDATDTAYGAVVFQNANAGMTAATSIEAIDFIPHYVARNGNGNGSISDDWMVAAVHSNGFAPNYALNGQDVLPADRAGLVLNHLGSENFANPQAASDLPTLVAVNVNGGLDDPAPLPSGPLPTTWVQQRSSLREIELLFDGAVTATIDHFTLRNLGVEPGVSPVETINLLADHLQVGPTSLTLTFDHLELPDGVYELTVAGATDSTSRTLSPVTLRGNSTNQLYQFVADFNGDSAVSIFDFSSLAYWFGQAVGEFAPQFMDLNGDNGVSIFDFPAFRDRFANGVTLLQRPETTNDGSVDTPFAEIRSFDAVALDVLLNDLEGQQWTITDVQPVVAGEPTDNPAADIWINLDGTIGYEPADSGPAVNGVDQFSYVVRDPSGASSTSVVTVSIQLPVPRRTNPSERLNIPGTRDPSDKARDLIFSELGLLK